MNSRAGFRIRIRFIFTLVLIFALVLLTRLYFVQIVYGEIFSERADRQYVRPNQNLYDRGLIFFENEGGQSFSGATLDSGFIVAISPKELEDPEDVYKQLSSIIDIDRDIFFTRAGKLNDPYEEIANKVDKERATAIDELGIAGVNIYKERWRSYPGGELGSQMLGFVGSDGDTLSGRYGLERYYDDVLSRKDSNVDINFFADVFANVGSSFLGGENRREGDIITAIELSVQLMLEDALREIHSDWNSKLTAGIIIDPTNGEIYALAVIPTFDLNSFSDEEDSSVFSNPIAESVYEMGSIIKPLTMAAGIDSGAVTAKTTYYDKGYIDLDGATISNFDAKGRGYVNMQEVLSQSLNTGAAFVVGEIGNKKFAEYMLSFGIGEETGIDLPNESAGLVDNLNSPRDLEYATAGFGQGIAMTPISTVRALSSLANGGVLVTPHIVKEVKYESGLSKKVTFIDGERVIKENTSDEITRMLVKVVDKALLGGTVSLPNYSIAAKTGTAQIAKLNERGYYDDRFLHSFFGYFPAYDPQFLIFLYTVEPKGVRYASQTLTHPFINLTKFLINFYDIPPDR